MAIDSLEKLYASFEMLEDWEERYRMIIEMGKRLTEFPESEKTEGNKVQGCISQVWMVPSIIDSNPPRLEFIGDSDSHIVKGLVAILRLVYSGRSADEIRQTDINEIFRKLDLEEHLSPNRRNGFYAMVERIKSFADQGSAVH